MTLASWLVGPKIKVLPAQVSTDRNAHYILVTAPSTNEYVVDKTLNLAQSLSLLDSRRS